MKRLKRLFALFVLLLFLTPVIKTYATGDSNIDGGGGSMGNGTATDIWRGQEGIRVTVVTTDGSIASPSFDLTNASVSKSIINFGKISKQQYTSGTTLSIGGTYVYSKPDTPLPRIIDGSITHADINAIRKYFCSEYAAKLIANKTGITYKELVSGKYKVVIEPIAYFTHGGLNYAMTATEAALYNQKVNGKLRNRMTSLTHQNLPLAIFLEVPDLGYPAWSGPTNKEVTDKQILSTLGIGIVSYKDSDDNDDNNDKGDPPNKGDEESEPDIEAPNYTYRVDTDVITSITLTSGVEVNPDNPATVTFYINGRSYTVNNVVIPAGGSQIVWVKWHTPSEPTTLTITASVSGATTGQTTFTAKVVSLNEKIPPDPKATDTNPRFSVPARPSKAQNTSAAWSVWSAWWQADWRWVSNWAWVGSGHTIYCPVGCTSSHGYWVDNGKWKDFGKYIFESTSYSATLTGSMEIHPDDIVPTASGDLMKSGYGIKETARARLIVNAPSSDYTTAQTAVTYFPEFSYKNYWRLLNCSGGLNATFTFRPNEFSTYNRCVHFIPVWVRP